MTEVEDISWPQRITAMTTVRRVSLAEVRANLGL